MNDVTQSHAAWTPDGETEPRPTEDAIIAAIAEVYDPEIPVNIYELGLIYAIEIADDGVGEGRDDIDCAGLPVGSGVARAGAQCGDDGARRHLL